MTESTHNDRYGEVEAALLAWAREKCRKPFTFCGDGIVCDFCHNKQAAYYDGRLDVTHASGCLALRAVAEGVA